MGRYCARHNAGSIRGQTAPAGPPPVTFEQGDTVYEGEDPNYVLGVNARSAEGLGWSSVNRLYQVGSPDILLETSLLVEMQEETTWQFEGAYPGGVSYYATIEVPGQTPYVCNVAEPEGGG